MNWLAHDQVWSADDWWTIALLPPGMFLLTLVIGGAISAIDRDWGAIKFFAGFLGTVCLAAWLLLWALVGIFWAGGWL